MPYGHLLPDSAGTVGTNVFLEEFLGHRQKQRMMTRITNMTKNTAPITINAMAAVEMVGPPEFLSSSPPLLPRSDEFVALGKIEWLPVGDGPTVSSSEVLRVVVELGVMTLTGVLDEEFPDGGSS